MLRDTPSSFAPKYFVCVCTESVVVRNQARLRCDAHETVTRMRAVKVKKKNINIEKHSHTVIYFTISWLDFPFWQKEAVSLPES